MKNFWVRLLLLLVGIPGMLMFAFAQGYALFLLGRIVIGVANFAKEFIPWPPRSYVAKMYNIVHWTDMPRGGHFAAMEEPELFVNDLRTFRQIIGR